MIAATGNWSVPPDGGSNDNNNDDDCDDESSSNSSDPDVSRSLEQQAPGSFSLDSLEEVSRAVDACKKAVLETEESSDGRKELVLRLIKLRIRFHDLLDRQERPLQGFEARGHVLVNYGNASASGIVIPGISHSRRVYCQQCSYRIWVYLQSSEHCTECGFSIHTSCTEGIMRECVGQKVRSSPDFILDICPEKSLPQLKYRCVECDRKLSSPSCGGGGSGSSSEGVRSEPRLCDYTGLTYCPRCHWNATSITPARIVHNWDFEPRPVSQAAKQYLFLMYSKPVISVEKANSKLFAVVPELSTVRQMRKEIMLMKKYLQVCRIALEQKLLLHLAERQHFVDGSEFYSLRDLVDTRSGWLGQFLQKKMAILSDHIRSCLLCVAKGFICEICDKSGDTMSSSSGASGGSSSTELIFPFDDVATTCDSCQGVFHRQCFKQVSDCPRCLRKRMRSDNGSVTSATEDNAVNFEGS